MGVTGGVIGGATGSVIERAPASGRDPGRRMDTLTSAGIAGDAAEGGAWSGADAPGLGMMDPLRTVDPPRTMDSLGTMDPPRTMGHLRALEAESIHILREGLAESTNPVLLYSIGKDSSVLLHLAIKAFAPGKLPFPLLHVDTTWKFREMIAFRDERVRALGLDLVTHTNPEGLARGIGPITHGTDVHTDVMKTQALRQALDAHGYDLAFGGARRDEEKSRAKERVFSLRTAGHQWDPRRQRPEPWRLYNGRKRAGETMRVFPLSNWTELDVWLYIHAERIPVVPLYFAAPRPVIERDGALLMVDDERLAPRDGETVRTRSVRFRTLGCYPLTGAVESRASTLAEVIGETVNTRSSERAGRAVDHADAASMERRKQEGYF